MEYYYKSEISRENNNETQYCNICNSVLNVIYGYKKNSIISCTNIDCKSNFNKIDKWKAIYDDDKYLKKINNIKNKYNSYLSVKYWLNKGYSEDEAIKKISDIQKENSKKVKNRVTILNKKYWLNKGYSEDEAIKKISDIQKENSNRCVEHWIKKGYTLDEAIKKISKIQDNSKFIDYKNIKTPMKLDFWLNISPDIEICKKYHKMYCKEKYSVTPEKIGEEKYNNMMLNRKNTYNKKTEEEKLIINKSKGRTFDQLVKEKGIEIALEMIKVRISNYRCKKRYSNISKELFESVVDNNIGLCYFAENEYYIKHDNGVYYVDFKLNNKIIEFNGTVFHADKRFYIFDDNPNPFNKQLTAESIWLKDEKRMNKLKELGYDILIIWEYDYLTNKDDVINKCKKFLKDE